MLKRRWFGYFQAQLGFSLIELTLALAISSAVLLAALTTHSQLWAVAWQGQQQMREEQGLQALAHWLMRDIRQQLAQHRAANFEGTTAATTGFEWQFQSANQCLLYGESGVRVRSGQLQWRPQHGDCESAGWLALHDSRGFKINHFSLQALATDHFQLCVRGEARQARVQMAETEWCYLFK